MAVTFMPDLRPHLHISREQLETLKISTEDAVRSVETLLKGVRNGTVWSAPKAVIQPPDGRYMMATLCAADQPPYMAVKALLLNPKNRDRGLKDIQSVVTLLASDTGLPVATMDGNWVTEIRTAAISAFAAKNLARSDSEITSFIGCGIQAHQHLRALVEMFPLREIRAFGRGSANRDSLCLLAESMGLKAVASTSAESAILGSDIVVSTVTLSQDMEPFVNPKWLKEGSFACITDLGGPWMKQPKTAFDRIFVDDLAQESKMTRPMVDLTQVTGDLLDLADPEFIGRRTNEEKSAFFFRGIGLGDLAIAALAFEKFRHQGRTVSQ